jgi:hypothetical protein
MPISSDDRNFRMSFDFYCKAMQAVAVQPFFLELELSMNKVEKEEKI